MNPSLDIGDVAFYWRSKTTPDEPPRDIPVRLPFEFIFEPSLQLIAQKPNPVVLRWLERVYQENANVGYLQEGHDLAAPYGGEFLRFFDKSAALLPQRPSTVADIGCGGVYLLRVLKERGFKVCGVDPSPVTAAAGAALGIEIAADFYPSPRFDRRFDLVYHHNVLEHVPDPVQFLRAHHDNLAPGGGILMAVPDCTPNIRLGDISMLLHEHINYFDAESLEAVNRAAGFRPLLIERSDYGGVLFCFAVADPSTAPPACARTTSAKFDTFRHRFDGVLSRFRDYFGVPAGSPRREIGIYVPIRVMPYLCMLDVGSNLRFFNDDSGVHGKYYDGFDVPVENLADLCRRPPTDVLIASLPFGKKIEARIRDQCRAPVKIRLLQELLDG